MSRVEQIEKLQQLRNQGALTEDEFQAEKQRLLNMPEIDNPNPYGAPPPPPVSTGYGVPSTGKIWGMAPRVYCMVLHLSQLAGYALPGAGWAVPIVMWAANKDQSPEIDVHGKIVLNWMITALIAGFLCFLLSFILIGIPLLFILGLVCIIYPIIGGIKANDGQVWHYPGSFKFI